MYSDLVKLDGREYTVTAPGYDDWVFIEQSMRAEKINTAQQVGLTGDDLQRSIDRANTVSVMSNDGWEWLFTMTGSTRLVYRSLLKNQPDVTLEQCSKWVFPKPHAELFKTIWRLVKASMSDDAAKKNEQQTSAENPPPAIG